MAIVASSALPLGVRLRRSYGKVLAGRESDRYAFLCGKYLPEREAMSMPNIPPVDAELALAEVHARREQVVSNIIPSWFWSAIGALILVFVAALESHRPWAVAIGTAVYAAGLATVILAVVGRTHARVRPALLGARGGLAIAGFTVALVGVGLALGFTLQALGVPMPATLGCVPVAVAMAAGGPRLMAYLRRLMLSRPLAESAGRP
jgi:hypothetical protein